MMSSSSVSRELAAPFPLNLPIPLDLPRSKEEECPPKLSKFSCLYFDLPTLSEMPPNLRSVFGSPYKAEHLPMLFALSSLKSSSYDSVYKVSKGDITPEDAFIRLSSTRMLTPREKVIAQIGLLALGLNPAASNDYGNTVFHVAASERESQFMEAALSYTEMSCHPPLCSLSELTGQGNINKHTPLALAAQEGCDGPLKLLLGTGCSEKDKGEALYWAAYLGHGGAVSLLLDTDRSEKDKGRALYWAAYSGHGGAVGLLLDAGCSEENRGKALCSAAYLGHGGAVGLLLASGCREKARGEALCSAVERGQKGSVGLLLGTGCSEVDRGKRYARLRRGVMWIHWAFY